MINFLEWWGGVGYTFNKISLYLAGKDGKSKNKNSIEWLIVSEKWRIVGWSVYLIGLPAWVIILVSQQYWMVAGVETGGVFGMILGLKTAIRKLRILKEAQIEGLDLDSIEKVKSPKALDRLAKATAYIMLLASAIYSWIDYDGLTSFTQILEISLVAGFLFGTYYLAKKNPNGWLWFILMNGSNVVLQFYKGKYVLAGQQVISLFFDILGYKSSKKKIC